MTSDLAQATERARAHLYPFASDPAIANAISALEGIGGDDEQDDEETDKIEKALADVSRARVAIAKSDSPERVAHEQRLAAADHRLQASDALKTSGGYAEVAAAKEARRARGCPE